MKTGTKQPPCTLSSHLSFISFLFIRGDTLPLTVTVTACLAKFSYFELSDSTKTKQELVGKPHFFATAKGLLIFLQLILTYVSYIYVLNKQTQQ